MRIDLRLLDAQLADANPAAITAILEDENGRVVTELQLRSEQDNDGRYVATYLPDEPGVLNVRIDDPLLAALADDLELNARVEVYQPDDEMRNPEADHALLANLAGETNGRMLTATDLADLHDIMPKRQVTTINPLAEPIWNTPLAFLLILLALTGEWIGRKVLRLA